jgi:predicted nucleic acid-binding protein
MATVYLDASLISAIVTDRSDPSSVARRELAREWWDSQRASHELFISQEVIRELSDPTYRHKDAALALVADLSLLTIDQEVGGVAEILVKEHLMPAPAVGDAIHVALCAVHDIEYLLSFNVRHLANPNKTAHLAVVCRRLGLVPPRIVTPDFLWEDA